MNLFGDMKTVELEEMNLSKRHLNAIDYAFKCIKDSELFPYIEKIILYGSCARGTAKWNSDVDLCIILSEDSRVMRGLSPKIHYLKGIASASDVCAVEADLKFFIGNDWEQNNSLFCNSLREDGKILWQCETI